MLHLPVKHHTVDECPEASPCLFWRPSKGYIQVCVLLVVLCHGWVTLGAAGASKALSIPTRRASSRVMGPGQLRQRLRWSPASLSSADSLRTSPCVWLRSPEVRLNERTRSRLPKLNGRVRAGLRGERLSFPSHGGRLLATTPPTPRRPSRSWTCMRSHRPTNVQTDATPTAKACVRVCV